jgi:hypothetical protein
MEHVLVPRLESLLFEDELSWMILVRNFLNND